MIQEMLIEIGAVNYPALGWMTKRYFMYKNGGGDMNKVYVDVIAEFSKDGCLIPILFVWEDGRKYKIDKVLKIERCASRKAGGVGMMYTCMVQGKPFVF